MTITSGIQYVDPDYAGGSSDGMTSDPWLSASLAEANFSGTCDGNCEIRGQASGGTADTTALTINFNVGAFTFNFRAARNGEWGGGNPTGGFYGGASLISTSHYRLVVANTCILIQAANVTVDGLQIEVNTTSSNRFGIQLDVGPATVLRCRLRAVNLGRAQIGIWQPNSVTGEVFILAWNAVVGFGDASSAIYGGISAQSATNHTPTFSWYNNLTYGGGHGFYCDLRNLAATLNLKNNVGHTNSGTDIALAYTGSPTLDIDYNATEDAAFTEAGANFLSLSGVAAGDIWTSPGTAQTANFHRKDGVYLAGAGTNAHAGPDFDDETPSTTFDIGPDWAAAAGARPQGPLGHPLTGPLGGPI